MGSEENIRLALAIVEARIIKLKNRADQLFTCGKTKSKWLKDRGIINLKQQRDNAKYILN